MPPYRPLALLAALTPLAPATAAVWPGAAPCNTTLQACIDATPNGGSVVLESDATIDESINLYNRSLSVVAGAGRRPTLAPGNWIIVSSAAILGDQSVTLRGLRLRDSYVSATYSGVGTATYDFSGLVFEQTSLPAYLRIEGRPGNTVQAQIYDNRIAGRPRNLNAGLIELVNGGGTFNATAYYNQVSNTSAIATDGAGIFVDTIAGGSGTVKLHGNVVRGGFFRAGLFVSEGLFSSTASDFNARLYNNVVVCADNSAGGGTSGSGISFTVGNGHIDGQAVNNTITRCNNGINANQWSGGGAGATIGGLVKNNLVVGQRGLAFTAGLADSLTNDYNLLNVATNFTAPGPNTITSDARLVGLSVPRLRADSPAVNAADTATLGLGIIFNALPTNDADGLRRIKGGSDDADIGAYEYGDRSLTHVATSANTSGGYITRIDNAVLDNDAAANPIATPNWNASGAGVANDTAFGIYYFGGKWRLFNEDTTTPMPLNAGYNVFAPAPGGGAFRHISTAANTSGYVTRLDNGSVNNLPDRIILVTQNWSAGSEVYNAHPIGLNYLPASGGGEWRIVNIDLATGGTMPVGAGFNVYAQQASPNAFRVSATSATSSIVLDHPLLNDTPCARLHVTRLIAGTPVPNNFDVYYGAASGRWRIFSYSTLQPGNEFNVVVDPAQVLDCTDRIFANGFQ
ncbi:MAG TPA: choice-of-anchor Q domain-containing protein [Tahibacter sp.]|uniref:DUF7452 domain-containing protein n=1 Tax=Tahibacter sp. TaxID=2056211 RepID=UPI002CE1B7F1|nr:choice-of-anchor Q domain-containing protein [Tahibacter sp.]HSX59911.1 choice-of-anchor Q domain-containing protein [Tahibacter sp.]